MVQIFQICWETSYFCIIKLKVGVWGSFGSVWMMLKIVGVKITRKRCQKFIHKLPKALNPGKPNSCGPGVRVQKSPLFQKILYSVYELQMTWDLQIWSKMVCFWFKNCQKWKKWCLTLLSGRAKFFPWFSDVFFQQIGQGEVPEKTEQPHIFRFFSYCLMSRPPKSKNRTQFGAKMQAVEFCIHFFHAYI